MTVFPFDSGDLSFHGVRMEGNGVGGCRCSIGKDEQQEEKTEFPNKCLERKWRLKKRWKGGEDVYL